MIDIKFKATIEIEDEFDSSEFSEEKIELERKLRYKTVKESLQELLDELLSDEFQSVKVKQVKLEWNNG